jgi:diguanylate cyclase (GGDEF)-like protein
VYTNARLGRVIGVPAAATLDDLLGTVIPDDRPALRRALDAVLDDGVDTDLELRLQMADTGRLHLCAFVLRALSGADGAPDGAVLCIDDVTEAAQLRAELERRAMVDDLTGCLNRATVLIELDRVLRRHAAGSPGTAVVYLDLDGFKGVNDTYGHKAGDELLTSVVARLGTILRTGDVIGRLGGDEFIVVLPFVDGMDEAMQVGRRLADALAEPTEIVGGRPMRIRASIGIAWASAADVTAVALTSSADLAMYRSKRIGTSEPVGVFV